MRVQNNVCNNKDFCIFMQVLEIIEKRTQLQVETQRYNMLRNMKHEPAIEWDFEDPVGVPDMIRRRLLRILKSCTSLLVEEHTGGGKWARIGKLGLTCKPNHLPNDPLDSICEAAMQYVHARWWKLANDGTDEALSLRVRFTCYHNEDGKPDRRSFIYDYKPGAQDEMAADMSLEHEVLSHLLDQSMRSNDDARAHITEIYGAMLNMTTQSSGVMGSIGGLLTLASALATNGTNALISALTMKYDDARITAEMADRKSARDEISKRINAGIAKLAPYVGIGLKQLLAKKLGLDFSESVAAPVEEQAEEEEAQPEHPLAVVANTIGRDLSTKQHREILAMLTKAQLTALYEMLEAETDDALIAGVRAFRKVVPDTKMMELTALLTPEQQQIVMQMIATAEKAGKASAQ